MKARILSLFAVFFVSILLASSVFAQTDEGDDDTGPKGMGMRTMTDEEKDALHKKYPAAKHIKANKLALSRVNAEREKKGLPKIDESSVDLAPYGEETMGAPGGSKGGGGGGGTTTTTTTTTTTAAAVVPSAVDNSTLNAFPPIGNQGSQGSCVGWASTYYWATYENAMARGWNAKTGGNDYRFSPRWTYNMINNGVDSGSSFGDAFPLLQKHGAANLTDLPYSGSDFRSWCVDPSVWVEAARYRLKTITSVVATSQSGIDQLKQQLANGHVMAYGTFVSSWVYVTVGNDPSTSADDSFVGQKICRYMKNTNQGGHAMTLVGYNDNIWCDVNANGVVNSGEKGAFKVANSWGTSYGNAGFMWVAYDAVCTTTQVSGGPTDRKPIFASNGYAYTATVDGTYVPKVMGVFTVKHAKRNQLLMRLGLDATSRTIPTILWTPHMIKNQGGAYAFNGTTTEISGTFAYDFTDLNPPTGITKRYFLGMNDNLAGSPATLTDFYLVDGSGNLLADSSNSSQSADANEKWCWVDHNLGTIANLSPNAVASASLTTGVAPLATTLSASGSSDPDGTIVSYSWNFGDGTVGSGSSVSHTYSAAGTYNAVLTVTDDDGATDTANVSIVVSSVVFDNVVTAANNDGLATEGSTDTGSFKIVRTGSLTAPLAVNYVMSGTAQNGVDYQLLNGTATIPAGATQVIVTVTSVDDLIKEGKESVVITLKASASYTLGATISRSLTLADNEISTVTIKTTDASCSEAGDQGVITVARSAPLTSPLVVYYTASGAAVNGTDYQAIPTSVTIPAGVSSVVIPINAINDTLVEGTEAFKLRLSDNSEYQYISSYAAYMNILDND